MKLTPTLGGSYSGSLGGLTASHNRGGVYLRRRATPVNPNTIRQQTTKAALGGLVQAWTAELTEAQRQAWRDYATNTPTTDKLGQALTLTGQQAYVRSNTPRVVIGSMTGLTSRADDAPTIFDTGEPVLAVSTFEINNAVPPGSLEIDGSFAAPLSDSATLAIQIGPPQNPGVTYFKGPYQYAAFVPLLAAAATTWSGVFDLDDPTQWFSDIVPTAAQDGVFFPLRLRVLFDDGRLSQAFSGLIALVDVTP